MNIRNTNKETKRKYNYVYKLTLKEDPSVFYIGKRSTDNLEDGYMGSGKALKEYFKKYGKDCFNKEILSYWNTAEEALIEEKRLVTKDIIKNENCLNRIVGGGNFDTLGCKWGPRTIEQIEKNRQIHLGVKQSDETKLKRSISIKEKWQDPEYRAKQILSRKGKYDKHLKKLSNERINKICIIKDGHWKYINESELNDYINDGWKRRGVENKPTYQELLEYRTNGLTYEKIGKIYGVKESCVRQWLKNYQRKLK